MKVTYSWLKNFVNLKATPEELAQKLTMAGLEVVSLEKQGQDFVLEIEITSNRPDWLSVLGIAREVSAIYGLVLKDTLPRETKIKTKELWPIKISVSDKKDCPFYSARIISGVKVGASPDWLRSRLESLGCRSVNNIVDITNYCLFELGQPLHAFDLDKLSQREIRVRRAKSGEKILAIDGVSRQLDQDILVIADSDKPVAIAGIMGGKETEVTAQTRNILLESAVFDPVLVRRGKQKLGLQSESAYRFERGVDPQGAKRASTAAQELILKLAGGAARGLKSSGAVQSKQQVINLELNYVSKILGISIPAVKARQILKQLGFQVKAKAAGSLAVKTPSFRQDVQLPIDLVEELARIYGYEKIPKTLPAVKPARQAPEAGEIISGMKNILTGLGLHEAITYSLIDRQLLQRAGIPADNGLIEILNPLSKEQEILRPALIPSLIRAVAYNLNQQQEKIGIFEIADVFSGRQNAVEQKPALGIALCGTEAFFTKQGLVRDEITLLHLKGALEILFNRLGIRDYGFVPQEDDTISVTAGGAQAGFLLELGAQILENFDIKNRKVVLAQIDLEKLFTAVNLSRKFAEIPKYPAITRDISFMLRQDIAVEELLQTIKSRGGALLAQARVADYYQGKQIPSGFKGLTLSCTYRSDSRTLTEEEVAPLHNDICALLKERFEVKLR